jgi:hypothetical protein
MLYGAVQYSIVASRVLPSVACLRGEIARIGQITAAEPSTMGQARRHTLTGCATCRRRLRRRHRAEDVDDDRD